MLFTSPIFLFFFLPAVLLLYYISPHRFKNLVLLFSSIIFYMWGESVLVLVMIATIIIDFFAARIIEGGNAKFGLSISVISNLGMLGFFKYFNFGVENFEALFGALGFNEKSLPVFPHIVLPLGISFYTFQSLSYTIDVYRKEVKANRSLVEFAAFVTVFPQLVAGPIVRYHDVEAQFREKQISAANFSEGIRRFVVGLSKKMLIANPCAAIADSVFGTPIDQVSTMWSWVGIAAYSFQIFYDFSGYSDMAIGLGKMLGFTFLENFNYPYISKSIREFWQRWHISLSTWFRDYLYIPLGGSRGTAAKTYRNLLIVFFVTGLWHGASWNFVVWGLFHGAFLILERLWLSRFLSSAPIILSRIYALLVVVVGWVFFRSPTLESSIDFIGKMFSFSGGDPARSSYFNFYFFNLEYLIVAGLAVICASPVGVRIVERVSDFGIPNRYRSVAELLGLIALFFLSASFIAADSYNPFIYFRF